MEECTLFIGSYIHSTDSNKITCVDNGIIAVSQGKIIALVENDDIDAVKKTLPTSAVLNVVKLKQHEFLCPGFIDLHIHASQYPNAGLGYDLTLLEWLNTYTFPLEQKFQDAEFARKVYKAVVNRTLTCGTTTAVYFATIYLESCLVLAEVIQELGQRALVGKVNMNARSPDLYTETTSSSIADTEAFIRGVKNLKNPLVQPIITPRFAITCDLPLMKQLAKLAKEHDLYIQTHVSENEDEIRYVRALFPECENYTDVYDKAGLVTSKTVLAHGVHLTEKELKVLKERGAAIAHCPISNTSLQSGLCNARSLLDAGVHVGLGTDVSGGYSPSILNCMRAAMDVSIHRSYLLKNGHRSLPLSYHEAFYLSTLGAAKALKLDDVIGNFSVGKDFDALRIDLYCPDSPIDELGELKLMEKVQKFIYLGDDRNIQQVYVKGNLLKNKL